MSPGGDRHAASPRPLKAGETRWPAAAAVAAALLVQVFFTDRLVPGPPLLLPGLEALLLVGLLAADPSRISRESRDLRALAVVVILTVGAVNAVALVSLVNRLLGSGLVDGRELLGAAAGVWVTNVLVFGLGYWELDRGGPLGRAGGRPVSFPDLWFPQDGDPTSAPPGWKPRFVDYLFVALTSATAFSPTDTMPLSQRAKAMMGVQSLVSLLTIGLVAARAVNILR